MGGTRGQSWREIGTDAVGEPRYPGRFALGEARETVEQTRRPERLSTRPRVDAAVRSPALGPPIRYPLRWWPYRWFVSNVRES